MTDVESRIARLEEQTKGHGRQIDALNNRLNEIGPMFAQVATLTERLATAHANIIGLRNDFSTFRAKVEERDEDDRRERQQFNRWAIGIGVTIILGMITLAGVILSAGSHP